MNRIINLNQDRRKLLFEATARRMKVLPVIIEKDFWVCFTLNYLLNESKYKDRFIFKGGTSLSKCYGVIKRFSEDVDLVLRWDTIGFDDDEVYKERTKSQDSILGSFMNEKGASFIQNELKEDLSDNLASMVDGMEIVSDNDDSLILYVKYPALFSNSYISSVIKLEIGPVAEKTPIENRRIEPYCFNDFNVPNKEPFDAVIIDIARTFWEKVLILYAECNRPMEKKTPKRYSRHFYDVFTIYKSSYYPEIIENKSLFIEAKIFKSKYYRTAWSKIEESCLNNIKIVPSAERLKEISIDYENMKEMIFDNRPTFEQIISGLVELEKDLHTL